VIRVISGLSLALAFLALAIYGSPALFFAIAMLMTILCLFEMFQMLEAGAAPSHKYIGVTGGAAFCAVMYLGDSTAITAVTGSIVTVTAVASLFTGSKDFIETSANTLFALLFVAVPFSIIALIYTYPDGKFYVILIVAANAFCDTFAYYTGRAVGKTKLAPSISPGKTVEGFAGGAIGALAGAVAVRTLFMPTVAIESAAAAGIIAGLLGPLGDLAESSIKRNMGVKDSGWIIPGHGGVLDRVDSLLFSSVSFYIYMVIFIST